MKPPITTYQDVTTLVETFYSRVAKNEQLAPFFKNTDFVHHMPRMIDFWAFILIDKEGYKGQVFDKHRDLGIKQEHFSIWVQIFTETVDELFEGEKANLAKQRAMLLSHTFQSKLDLL